MELAGSPEPDSPVPIAIPARPVSAHAFSGNKTGTFLPAMLYVDNPGIAGLRIGKRIGSRRSGPAT